MAKTKGEQEQDDAEAVHVAKKGERAPETPSPLNQAFRDQAVARAIAAEDDKRALEQVRAEAAQTPAKKAREEAQKKTEAEYKDRESRTVQVRAKSRGFYPADGRIRNEGDVFDYVLNKDEETDEVEEELPSWMEDVDGKVKTRSLNAKRVEKPLVIEVHGKGADATVAKK